MPSLFLVSLSVIDIILYTIRSYTNKLFAMSFDGDPRMATPVFSSITGLSGFLFTLLWSQSMEFPSMTTLLCGVSGGCILFLYDYGNIRAAKTGPYSIQSVIGMFGCVLLPLLFERVLWDVHLSGLQLVGVVAVLFSFIYLNRGGNNTIAVQKGFYGWVALLFFANGIYSTIVVAQQRWTGYEQRCEMIAVVFLTMATVSFLYLIFGCKANIKNGAVKKVP